MNEAASSRTGFEVSLTWDLSGSDQIRRAIDDWLEKNGVPPVTKTGRRRTPRRKRFSQGDA
jgi:hypothetical protein